MAKTPPTQELQTVDTQTGELMLRPDLHKFLATFEQVPEIDQDPTPQMLEFILNAETWEEYEALFKAEHFQKSVNEDIILHAIRKMESDHKDGFPFYLLLDVTMVRTKKRTVMTCGSMMAMAIAIRHHMRGELPFGFTVERRERETRAGRHPMRLKAQGPWQELPGQEG